MGGLTVVTGAAGFVGRALVAFLRARGEEVRAVDVRIPSGATLNWGAYDLRDPDAARATLINADTVYHLAARMGGVAFSSKDRLKTACANSQIDANVFTSAGLQPRRAPSPSPARPHA